jgi:hypothetical protein
MRPRLLAPLVALLLAGPAAAADPAVVFQVQPVGRVLNDTRVVVGTVVGPKEAESINDAIKARLGPKGFAGLDLNRPLLGYVHVPANPMDAAGVLVVPVTGEEDFLGFFERLTGAAPKAEAGGLYTVPLRDPDFAVGFRFADGHAYLATALKISGGPAAVLGKDQLVPTAQLYDPADPSLLAVRLRLDRLPKELRGQAKDLLAAAKKAAGTIPFPPELAEPAGKAVGEGVRLAERWLKLSEGAKEVAVRLTLDAPGAEMGAELTVVPLPGSELGKLIAARKPTTNRFAGLLTPDTATGFVTRLPLFNDELRAAATDGLEGAQKATANLPGPGGELLQEFLKGAVRTVKTGEVDVAGAIRGPDKNGQFTTVGAVAFEDPAGVEKALKAVIEREAPPEFKKVVKWNAEKVGGVAVHVLEVGKLERGGGFNLGGPESKAIGGADAKVALAFAPKAMYVAAGPDAVGAMKGLLALKAGEAPVLTVTINPSRWVKFMTTAGAPPRDVGEFSRMFGTDDRPVLLGSLAVTGGGELRVTGRVSMRSTLGLFGRTAHSTFERVEPAAPPKN